MQKPTQHHGSSPELEDERRDERPKVMCLPDGGILLELTDEQARRFEELDAMFAAGAFQPVTSLQVDEQTARRLEELDRQMEEWARQEAELAPVRESAADTLEWYMEWFETQSRQTQRRRRPGRRFKAKLQHDLTQP